MAALVCFIEIRSCSVALAGLEVSLPLPPRLGVRESTATVPASAGIRLISALQLGRLPHSANILNININILSAVHHYYQL